MSDFSNQIRSKRGSALILTLWVTSVLTGLSWVQATRVSLEHRWADRLRLERQAWYLAYSGISAAAVSIQAESGYGPVSRSGSLASGTFTYRISDEQARIPLNVVSSEILENLPGCDGSVVAGLMALRADETQAIRHLSEMVSLGVDPAVLAQLELLVTVVSPGPVNLNSASARVLTLMGLSQAVADRIVVYRAGSDGQTGSGDDRVFQSKERVLNALVEAGVFPGLDHEDPDRDKLQALIQDGLVGTDSSFFRVEAEGSTFRLNVRQRILAVLEKVPGSRLAEVRMWHEAA